MVLHVTPWEVSALDPVPHQKHPVPLELQRAAPALQPQVPAHPVEPQTAPKPDSPVIQLPLQQKAPAVLQLSVSGPLVTSPVHVPGVPPLQV